MTCTNPLCQTCRPATAKTAPMPVCNTCHVLRCTREVRARCQKLKNQRGEKQTPTVCVNTVAAN